MPGRGKPVTIGFRHDDLRRRNRAMVTAALRWAERISRTDLASRTGLSHSTISAISADLIAERVLVEMKGSEVPAAKRGRPQVALALNPQAATIMTIVLALNSLW